MNNFIKREEGFWSTFIVLVLVTLALMGMGGFVLIKSEGRNVVNQVYALQTDYVANSGAYYGIRRLGVGPIDETVLFTVGNGTFTLDTSKVTGLSDIWLTVNARVREAEREIEIHLAPGGSLKDKAIYTTGDVFNVSGKDSLGNPDPDLVVTNADSVPTIEEDSLKTMALNQGHVHSDSIFSPVDNYPDTSFYQPDGITPNVIYVQNDFKVMGGRTIYGIYIIEGDVILAGSARIDGIIYLPDSTSTIITGGGDPGESSITGGIVSNGDISGTGNHISVQHWPDYMRVFCGFQKYPSVPTFKVVSWVYN